MSQAALNDQLRSTLGRLDAALSCVEDALALTNNDGIVEWTNRAFDHLVDRPRLASLGRPLPVLLPSRFINGRPDERDDLIARAVNGAGCSRWDLSSIKPRRVLEVTWSPVLVKPTPSLVFVFRDLSAITKVQDELRWARDNLEQEVQSRTEELLQARDQALAAQGAMGRFLANVSHEIRTPMNAVIGMTDLLLGTALDGHQSELVDTIHTSGELLLELINNILDLSKIQSEEILLSTERLSLRSLVEECCGMLRPLASGKGLTFEALVDPEVPELILGDDMRLRQVVLNLLNNAIKFTQRGFVRLSVRITSRPDGSPRLEIEVEDSGPGIASDFLPHIFEAYTQADGASRQVQGSGLGLSICHRLCHLMGGSIEVSSRLGEGTRLRVELPLRPSLPLEAPPKAMEPGDGAPGWPKGGAAPTGGALDQPPRILVAEDNRINQRVLELLLNQLGLSADFVDDGQAAIERVGRGDIDLVLMDLQMPSIDGLEATHSVRRRSGPQPYIVALTALAFADQKQACLDAGMNDFLSKPVRRRDLEATLGRYDLWLRSQRSGGDPQTSSAIH
ncbi:ATP-binding protein [Cyanobium sp. Morenito 9A2]|uniref:ATP-binding protein n=1 Tax=Cyanobium sp. Morenito 9A2 TaxID=2823718 RepID=UPI0020CD6A4A|nr:ATP-binding protein [Cyanobium sp. Morenito 9A2]MCP9849417.1 response regulator [Cyanobium sp. Morenito 9A2]